MLRHVRLAALVLGLVALHSLVLAQQPPGKTDSTKQPPAKTGPAPDKTAPAKNTPTQPGAAPEQLVAYTYDGVRIEGDFYPAPAAKAKTTPCLILVHPVGPKHFTSSRADFGKLPEKLQRMGYAVAVIDLRGYGKSKTVETRFWNTHRAKTRNLDLIEGKDYSTSLELLEMVQDLTAVKIWLNTKNNAKECNSQAIGVIGLEQGGLIALAWAANEMTDPNRTKQRNTGAAGGGFPNPAGQGNTGFGNAGFGNTGVGNTGQFGNAPGGGNVPRFEGEDITCVIAVSTANRLNDSLNMGLLERWITYLRERQIATMGIYGANDKEATAFWNKAGLWAKPTSDKYRYKYGGTRPIKNTSLVGAKLLMNDSLDVTKTLEDYLQDALKKVSESRLWAEQFGPDRPAPFEVQRLLR